MIFDRFWVTYVWCLRKWWLIRKLKKHPKTMRGPSKINVERFRFTQKNIKNQSKNYPIGIKILIDFWIDFWNDFWSIFGRFFDWFWHQNRFQNHQQNRSNNQSKKWSHLGSIFGRFLVDLGVHFGTRIQQKWDTKTTSKSNWKTGDAASSNPWDEFGVEVPKNTLIQLALGLSRGIGALHIVPQGHGGGYIIYYILYIIYYILYII